MSFLDNTFLLYIIELFLFKHETPLIIFSYDQKTARKQPEKLIEFKFIVRSESFYLIKILLLIICNLILIILFLAIHSNKYSITNTLSIISYLKIIFGLSTTNTKLELYPLDESHNRYSIKNGMSFNSPFRLALLTSQIN